MDTTGRKFNNNGQLIKWWKDEDITEYERRTECFEKQYTNYGVDGFLTLGENIADNVGFKISHQAYKNTKESHIPVVIPTLGVYTNEQLFFISFAQLWCEISYENPFLSESSEHSPVQQRVLGVIYNSEEFHDSFYCNSSYNKTKCTLW